MKSFQLTKNGLLIRKKSQLCILKKFLFGLCFLRLLFFCSSEKKTHNLDFKHRKFFPCSKISDIIVYKN